jgi:hypothetical protein
MRARLRYHDDEGNFQELEIYKAGYVGSVLELDANERPFHFEHEALDTTKPLEEGLIYGRLEMGLLIDSAAQELFFGEVKASQNRDFKIVWRMNSVERWHGYLNPNLSQFYEDSFPYSAMLVFKDFNDLEGIDFPLISDRLTIIKVFAMLFSGLGFNLPIKTVTDLEELNTDTAHDFLRQIYIDAHAIRQYAKEESQQDVKVTYLFALKKLLANYGLVCKIDEGCFLLDQISGYVNPASVPVNTYNSSGDFVSRTNENLVVTANTSNLRVLAGDSYTEFNEGIKQVTLQFDHRTPVSGIVLPKVIDTRPDGVEEFTQFFQSTGVERISIAGFAFTLFEELVTEIPYANIELKSGDLWWNNDLQQWQLQQYENRIDMRNAESREDFGQGRNFTARINIQTSEIPVVDSGDIVIKFFQFPSQANSHTVYRDCEFELSGSGEEESTSLQYILRQNGNYKALYNHPAFWYGDGPAQYAHSAMRFSTTTTDLTNLSWRRRGDSEWVSFAEALSKNIMDIQRVNTEKLNPTLYGNYTGRKVLLYNGNYQYYLGGTFNGQTGQFTPVLFNLNLVTDNDEFDYRLVQGPALLNGGILTAIDLARNETVEGISGYLFRLSLPIEGEVSQLVSNDLVNLDTVVLKDYKVAVSHPQTLKRVEFTVRENHQPGSNIINVIPLTIDRRYPDGSPVYISQRSVTTGLALGRNKAEFFSDLGAVAVLTQPVSGVVSSLNIYAYTLIRKGSTIAIFNEQLNQGFYAKLTETISLGEHEVGIQEELIIAPNGALVYQSTRELSARLSIEPGSVRASVEESAEENSIGRVSAVVIEGIETTQISLSSISDQVSLYDNQKLYIKRIAREDLEQVGEIINVDGDQVIGPGSGVLAIKPKTFTHSYFTITPAYVYEAGYQITSELTLRRGEILALAQYTDDLIDSVAGLELQVGDAVTDIGGLSDSLGTIGARSAMFADTNGNLAIIELLSGTISSFAGVKADQVEISGLTTFSSGYDPSTKETPTGAQNKANTAEDNAKDHADVVSAAAQAAAELYAEDQKRAARNNIASQMGYADYDAMVSEAVAGKTIINGGLLNTVLLDVVWLFAQNANVAGTLTIGGNNTSGVLKHIDGKWVIDKDGIYLGAGQNAYDQATALRVGNRIRIYGVDGDPAFDGGYFEFTDPTFLKFISQGDLVFDIASGKSVSFNRVVSSTAAASADNHFLRRVDADGRFHTQTISDSRFVRTGNNNQDVDGIKNFLKRSDFREKIRVYNSAKTNYVDLGYEGASGNRSIDFPQLSGTVLLEESFDFDGQYTVQPNEVLTVNINGTLVKIAVEV